MYRAQLKATGHEAGGFWPLNYHIVLADLGLSLGGYVRGVAVQGQREDCPAPCFMGMLT